ncbi:transglutaminase family protein [Gynurincola endophyticus]|jgi:regulator of sirC expression with transglutaminase-like and TPR domain|uniref:transglutaminase family protein n=1 Tax=Gynurincola endophyticus TaxID=2479004 RepID=UPI000F8C49C1|nr:transglutaminase family protein [Gynurincola endophyticus]
MNQNKEISSLFTLIDDPDEEVFAEVANRIITHGPRLIPSLEAYWEGACQSMIHKRIEVLIHRLRFQELSRAFEEWASIEEPDLLTGYLLVTKFEYPEINESEIQLAIEKLRKNVWLELNNYLTPLEQVNVLSSIFYNYYQLEGSAVNYEDPVQFYLNNLLEKRNGNTISNGLLYLIIADLLEIPVKVLNIPQHFLLGYFRTHQDPWGHILSADTPQFYIDPTSGSLYSQQNIDEYFLNHGIEPQPQLLSPIDSKSAIRILLLELSKCYQNKSEFYKYEELQKLAHLTKAT